MFTNHTHNSDVFWNRLQEPLRPTRQPGDYLLLLSALDDGWTILEARRIFSWDRRGHEDFYMLKLMHAARLQEREFIIKSGSQIDALLESQHVPIAESLTALKH